MRKHPQFTNPHARGRPRNVGIARCGLGGAWPRSTRTGAPIHNIHRLGNFCGRRARIPRAEIANESQFAGPSENTVGPTLLFLAVQDHLFSFPRGMPMPFFAQTELDPLGSSNGPGHLCVLSRSCLEDRVSLRADLGQSQSGNSSLSPRAYRAQSTTAELAVSEILPITSVRAPRYFAGRSVEGREGQLAKGGRTDRWPQMTAIRSRTILLIE